MKKFYASKSASLDLDSRGSDKNIESRNIKNQPFLPCKIGYVEIPYCKECTIEHHKRIRNIQIFLLYDIRNNISICRCKFLCKAFKERSSIIISINSCAEVWVTHLLFLIQTLQSYDPLIVTTQCIGPAYPLYLSLFLGN